MGSSRPLSAADTDPGQTARRSREYAREICREHGAAFQWLRGYYIVAADVRGKSIFSKLAAAEREIAAGAQGEDFTAVAQALRGQVHGQL